MAIMNSVNDFYATLKMPGRFWTSSSEYRYGFQGEYAEIDSETGFNHFTLRDYDSRIGRWTKFDPYNQYFSPYIGMGNNPVSVVDPSGGIGSGADATYFYVLNGRYYTAEIFGDQVIVTMMFQESNGGWVELEHAIYNYFPNSDNGPIWSSSGGHPGPGSNIGYGGGPNNSGGSSGHSSHSGANSQVGQGSQNNTSNNTKSNSGKDAQGGGDNGFDDYLAAANGAVNTYTGFMGDAFFSNYHHMQKNGIIRSAEFAANNPNKIYQTSRSGVEALTKNARMISKGTGILGSAISIYQFINEPTWANFIDGAAGATTFIPVVGWAISGTYFIGNLISVAYDGQTIGQRLVGDARVL